MKPTNMGTGRVTGQFAMGIADGADLDDEPEIIPLAGTVTFTPSVPYLPNRTAEPNPITIVTAPIKAVLDEEGYLCTPQADGVTPQYRGIRLFATDDEDTSVKNWTYSVTYRFSVVNGATPALKAHSISLPEGSEVDLTRAVEVPSSPGIGTPQALALLAEAEAAASIAAQNSAVALQVKADADAGLFQGETGPAGPNTVPTDTAIATNIQTPGTETEAALSAAIVADTGVTAADPAHTTKLIPDAGKNGLFIRNEQPTYALKVDQYDTNGAHDTVNIVANYGGEHTVVGIGSGNTSFSTVKVTNHGVQTAGQIVAALGTDPNRTAGIFGADNWGKGPSFVASSKGGDNIAFRAAYDPGAYTNSIFWATGHHTSGNLVLIENDGAHTVGSMLKLAQAGATSTASVITISNSGTGESITAPSFNLLKDGRTKLKQIENLSSFNNGQVKMTDAGIVADRNVADASPVVKIQNAHASSSGDILQLVKTGGEVVSRFTKDGGFVTKRNAAISDADLKLNEMMIWFDASAGAFKVKGKDAAGVVKTGTLALA